MLKQESAKRHSEGRGERERERERERFCAVFHGAPPYFSATLTLNL
jgi:hypothetical protein